MLHPIWCNFKSVNNISTMPQPHVLTKSNSLRVRAMAFKAILNNISFILRWSVLLVEETKVPGENHRPVTSH